MTCICIRYKAERPLGGERYAAGQKRHSFEESVSDTRQKNQVQVADIIH
jgi:hypothetical protein